MQDRYAGDIGDFGKYGLLRALCGADEHGPALELGVLWYRVPNEDHKTDGRIIDYLDPPDERLRTCDEPLFRSLRELVKSGERSVAEVQRRDILPAGTQCHAAEVPVGSGERGSWLDAGLRAVADVDVVFADPDNGLSSGDPTTARSPKHAYYDELKRVWERGQSLVIYQHATRHKGGFLKLIADRRQIIKEQLGGSAEPIVLRWRRRQARAYFIIPAPAHADRIRLRCSDVRLSAWGHRHKGLAHPHFELVHDS